MLRVFFVYLRRFAWVFLPSCFLCVVLTPFIINILDMLWWPVLVSHDSIYISCALIPAVLATLYVLIYRHFVNSEDLSFFIRHRFKCKKALMTHYFTLSGLLIRLCFKRHLDPKLAALYSHNNVSSLRSEADAAAILKIISGFDQTSQGGVNFDDTAWAAYSKMARYIGFIQSVEHDFGLSISLQDAMQDEHKHTLKLQVLARQTFLKALSLSEEESETLFVQELRYFKRITRVYGIHLSEYLLVCLLRSMLYASPDPNQCQIEDLLSKLWVKKLGLAFTRERQELDVNYQNEFFSLLYHERIKIRQFYREHNPYDDSEFGADPDFETEPDLETAPNFDTNSDFQTTSDFAAPSNFAAASNFQTAEHMEDALAFKTHQASTDNPANHNTAVSSSFDTTSSSSSTSSYKELAEHAAGFSTSSPTSELETSSTNSPASISAVNSNCQAASTRTLPEQQDKLHDFAQQGTDSHSKSQGNMLSDIENSPEQALEAHDAHAKTHISVYSVNLNEQTDAEYAAAHNVYNLESDFIASAAANVPSAIRYLDHGQQESALSYGYTLRPSNKDKSPKFSNSPELSNSSDIPQSSKLIKSVNQNGQIDTQSAAIKSGKSIQQIEQAPIGSAQEQSSKERADSTKQTVSKDRIEYKDRIDDKERVEDTNAFNEQVEGKEQVEDTNLSVAQSQSATTKSASRAVETSKESSASQSIECQETLDSTQSQGQKTSASESKSIDSESIQSNNSKSLQSHNSKSAQNDELKSTQSNSFKSAQSNDAKFIQSDNSLEVFGQTALDTSKTLEQDDLRLHSGNNEVDSSVSSFNGVESLNPQTADAAFNQNQTPVNNVKSGLFEILQKRHQLLDQESLKQELSEHNSLKYNSLEHNSVEQEQHGKATAAVLTLDHNGCLTVTSEEPDEPSEPSLNHYKRYMQSMDHPPAFKVKTGAGDGTHYSYRDSYRKAYEEAFAAYRSSRQHGLGAKRGLGTRDSLTTKPSLSAEHSWSTRKDHVPSVASNVEVQSKVGAMVGNYASENHHHMQQSLQNVQQLQQNEQQSQSQSSSAHNYSALAGQVKLGGMSQAYEQALNKTEQAQSGQSPVWDLMSVSQKSYTEQMQSTLPVNAHIVAEDSTEHDSSVSSYDNARRKALKIGQQINILAVRDPVKNALRERERENYYPDSQEQSDQGLAVSSEFLQSQMGHGDMGGVIGVTADGYFVGGMVVKGHGYASSKVRLSPQEQRQKALSVLELDENASIEQIKQQYLGLARCYNPEAIRDYEGMTEHQKYLLYNRLMSIREAYEYLMEQNGELV